MKLEKGIGLDRINHIAILGAAGKMGSGIALLILQQYALRLAAPNLGDKPAACRLTLIDTYEAGFPLLKQYLRDQLKKYAERNINGVRKAYAHRDDLVDNVDMITCFVDEAMDCVFFGTILEECRGAEIVFEAIVEDIDLKTQVLLRLNNILGPSCYFFSNTSSIPIHILQEKSQLQGRLIGFHFYNPPAVQRLIELIIPENISPELKSFAEEIARQLNKTVVFSKDIAGFIGNGHFIREVHFACQQVDALSQHMPLTEAIVLVNRLTQEFLLRPMGIFQLIDYVGIEVVQRIAHIMSTYLHQRFGNRLIDEMVEQKVMGGQFGNGSQKDGFFHYEKGAPVSVYDREKKTYILIDEAYRSLIDSWFGAKPPLGYTWNKLNKDLHRTDKVNHYLECLSKEHSQGARLAQQFLNDSQEITAELVSSGVADSILSVQAVLENGFYHLY